MNKFVILGMLFTIASNVLYSICLKTTSDKVSPFLSLSVTYLVAFSISTILFFTRSGSNSVLEGLTRLNASSWLLGVVLVALEGGYLLAFRHGMKVSVAALYSNSLSAVLLIPLGILLFAESPSLKCSLGIGFSMVGLVLLSR